MGSTKPASAEAFFEVYWQGESIGDGADLAEALACYSLVTPEDGDWAKACAQPDADPHIERHASFEAFLDNEDAQELIIVSAAMIEAALPPAAELAGD